MINSFPSASSNIPPTYESTPITMISREFQELHKEKKAVHHSLNFNAQIMNGHAERNSLSPSTMFHSSSGYSPSGRIGSSSQNTFPNALKMAEVETNTIHRQRKELQLMINELKERDKELNDMVHSHHSQLVSWQGDRQRISSLEKQLSRTKVELRKRHDKCKLLKERLQFSQSGVQSKSMELESTQMQLQQIAEKENLSSSQLQEITARNSTLQSSVHELSNKVCTLQSSEQEITTLLSLKNKDVSDANLRIEELTEKLKTTNKCLYDYKQMNKSSNLELERLRQDDLTQKQELDSLKKSMSSPMSPGTSPEEVSNLKQVIMHLQKELLLAGEREKRKDSLLELNRSRQERTEAELNHLRQLYDSLQKDNLILKKKNNAEDDSVSVFTESDIDERDTFSWISNNMKEFHKMSVPNDTTSRLNGNGNEHEKDDISVVSLKSEDTCAMTTGELKSHDLDTTPSSIDLHDVSISPTARLHKLLDESRKMVQSLEKSPTFSNQTTPEQIRGVDGYETPLLNRSFQET